jgi:hypothetical protein
MKEKIKKSMPKDKATRLVHLLMKWHLSLAYRCAQNPPPSQIYKVNILHTKGRKTSTCTPEALNNTIMSTIWSKYYK